MKHTLVLATLAAAGAALLGGSRRAAAEEPAKLVEMVPRYEKGDRFELDLFTQMDLKTRTTVEKKTGTAAMGQTRRRLFRNEVMELKGGTIHRVRREFRTYSISKKQVLPGRAPESDLSKHPIEGKTLELVGDGEVRNAPDEAKRLLMEDRRTTPVWDVLLPLKPVKAGDSWEPGLKAREVFLGKGRGEGSKIRCTFRGMALYKGERVARVEVELESTSSAGGNTVKVKAKGPLHFSIEKRKAVHYELKGEMTVESERGLLEGTTRMRGQLRVLERRPG